MGKSRGWGNKSKGVAHRKHTAKPRANHAGEAAAAPQPPPLVKEKDEAPAAEATHAEVDKEDGSQRAGDREKDSGCPSPTRPSSPEPVPMSEDVLIDLALEKFFDKEMILDGVAAMYLDMQLEFECGTDSATAVRAWIERIERAATGRDLSESESRELGRLGDEYESVISRVDLLSGWLRVWGDSRGECSVCGGTFASSCDCFRECDCAERLHARYPWQRGFACEAGRPHQKKFGRSDNSAKAQVTTRSRHSTCQQAGAVESTTKGGAGYTAL